jgi:DNA-binding PadR family transcriptional regulator
MHNHYDHARFSQGRAHHGGFGRHGFKPPFGPGGHAQMMAAFAGQAGRARRGDVRTAVLRLLAEQPMHGYQIIQELSERTEGAWSPSAGSVYPTLQMLADEDLITAEETAGKKVYSLTETGRATVAEMADQPAPWEEPKPSGVGNSAYRDAAGRLMQAVWQIGTSGSAEQTDTAVEVITEARKKLYAILAED